MHPSVVSPIVRAMASFHVVIPDNIRAERRRKDWIQSRLAMEIDGWTLDKVSSIESHETRLLVEDLVPLCRALGRTLSELAVGCDPEERAVLGI